MLTILNFWDKLYLIHNFYLKTTKFKFLMLYLVIFHVCFQQSWSVKTYHNKMRINCFNHSDPKLTYNDDSTSNHYFANPKVNI